MASKSKGIALAASLMVAPPAALAAFLAVQENDVFAIFNPAADGQVTVFILVMSYILTFCGLLIIGIPLAMVLDKDGPGSLVGEGLGIFAAACVIGAFATNGFEQLGFLTAGISSAIFAFTYLLSGYVLPQKPISIHDD